MIQNNNEKLMIIPVSNIGDPRKMSVVKQHLIYVFIEILLFDDHQVDQF